MVSYGVLSSSLLLALAVVPWCQFNAYRVAVIGGGISGTFTTKYLAEYDVLHRSSSPPTDDGSDTTTSRDCLLDEIIVYDVSPPSTSFAEENRTDAMTNSYAKVQYSSSSSSSSSDPRPLNWQGSRVSSVTLMDGSVVELGASIIYEGNQLVVDMINGDPTRLKRGKPNGIGKDVTEDGPSGFGIYHGDQHWLLNTASLFSKYPSFLQPILKRLYLLWRYNLDILRLGRAVKQAMQSFDSIYLLLNNTQHDVTYFHSPMDIWQTVGLRSLASVTFHELLDGIGLYRDQSLELAGGASSAMNYSTRWDWRKWVPGMGCMRAELLSAMAINTYNQDLNQMNGLVGLAAYISAVGEVFSIEGGNHQLMESALHQAKAFYHASTCSSPSRVRIQRLQKTITTVVASENSMELFEGTESLGNFDIVILAAPLQHCRIVFLMRSPMGLDDTVLHEMPLGGIKENLDHDDVSPSSKVDNNAYGHLFSRPLPSSATVSYTSVVTTLVSNATLNATHFGLRDDEPWPQTVFVSERGKLVEGITTLTILSMQNGLVKTFSSEVLDADHRNILFGNNHILEYVQIWGGRDHGRYGGATPNFAGGLNTESLPFLLYDGVEHWGKGYPIIGPALYYTNAIESAIAAMEISALGAKSTAKLVARRLGLIRPKEGSAVHDEL